MCDFIYDTIYVRCNRRCPKINLTPSKELSILVNSGWFSKESLRATLAPWEMLSSSRLLVFNIDRYFNIKLERRWSIFLFFYFWNFRRWWWVLDNNSYDRPEPPVLLPLLVDKVSIPYHRILNYFFVQVETTFWNIQRGYRKVLVYS